MLNTGYIKLFRKLIDWEWYTDDNVFRLFMHLLLKANFKDKNWRGQLVKRGQLIIGVEKFGAEINLTRQQTKTALKKLVSTNEITTKATNSYTLVTIVNFNIYQDSDNKNNHQDNHQINQRATNEQPTDNHQITTTKEGKKEKKERKKEYNREIEQSHPPSFSKNDNEVKNNQDADKKEKICAKKEKRPASDAKYYDEVVRVLTYLNSKTGQEFRIPKSKSTIERYGAYRLISAILSKKYEILDFKKVIDVKFNEWWGDRKMQKFIRPETLFNPNKFEGYLNQYYLEQKTSHEQSKTPNNNKRSNASIRANGNISPEFSQKVNKVLGRYGGTDGTEFLKQWRNDSNK